MQKIDYFIAIDTGGTFTDCIALNTEGVLKTCKVLSNSSLRGSVVAWINAKTICIHHNWQIEKDIFKNYHFRFLNTQPSNSSKHLDKYNVIERYDFIKKTLHFKEDLPPQYFNQKLSFEITAYEEAPILAARLITQTALDEAFPSLQMRLGSTKGTNALLERKGAKTAFFVTKGFKDLLVIKNQQRPDLFALNIIKSAPLFDEVIEINERLNADGSVFKNLITNDLDKNIKKLKQDGIESVAVTLMHSYRNAVHEKLLKNHLKKHFDYISISSDLSQQIKFVPRAETTVVNAYLAPIIDNYIKKINNKLPDDSLRVMTSAGGLVHASLFQPKDSLLSGPAGGIVGAATIGKQSGFKKLITFDMGGTSTDVARFDGDYDYKFDVSIGSATVFSPAFNIETVAAGGGSICYFDGFKLCVGPESAGASPGPACYGAGGALTITDVNLLLGRLDAAQFGIPIFIDAAQTQLTIVQNQIKEKTSKILEKEAILSGFLEIANERMADAIKKISVSKGYAPPQYALVAFGGAGGLHACSMAKMLDMDTILLPRYAGLLSAYGIMNASIERISEKQILKTISSNFIADLDNEFKSLCNDAVSKVLAEGVRREDICIKKRIAFCRIKGQDATLDIDFDTYFLETFKEKYTQIYGHWIDNRDIEVESIRVIASANPRPLNSMDDEDLKNAPDKLGVYCPRHFIKSFVHNQWQDIPVYFREDLDTGAQIKGFALLLDNYSTTVIEENFELTIDAFGTAIIKKLAQAEKEIHSISNSQAIDLELFINRFTNIADNMGAMLQRTALSVNVKERLDFSCALLDAEGYLIANAPHIPVHLGSLGVCVRTVIKSIEINAGDTIVTNHPAFGGSHLPDVTLITAVYTEGGQKIGYVCNRCHHSEIGGIRPASMPPNATKLIEEGVIIEPQYLMKNGVIDWQSIRSTLTNVPYPTRNVTENIADLNAALAANLNGVQALKNLAAEHSLEKVHHYMALLKNYTAERLQMSIKNQFKTGIYKASEKLDDGTVLKVKITIQNDKIEFDFKGTSPVHKGNLNATPAIVNSVVIYILRLLLKENIPLNEGIMQHISLNIPKNSILNPDFSKITKDNYPAVVGGNVETSQRLTDTILKALGILACGQGTMNNTLFGNATFGYYETICGGAGAGDGFTGADATHTHMTNTRITDPEIMELRYPVRLDEFSIRKNSGGKGLYKGGDGIKRKMTFLSPVELSILSQHRVVAPFGVKGGKNGKKGKQYLIFTDKSLKILRGIDGVFIKEGEQFVIETPGGGGYGKNESKK
jgi:5-oxoprolinase (ATP-hydrolysing)